MSFKSLRENVKSVDMSAHAAVACTLALAGQKQTLGGLMQEAYRNRSQIDQVMILSVAFLKNEL